MSYYFTKILETDFDTAIARVTDALLKNGFGVVSEIDMSQTFKNKLNIDFRKYKILGACNPNYALQAVTAEPHIGTMLPCNVIVQELESAKIEVSAVDPVASMQAVQNEKLGALAMEVQQKLKNVILTL